MVPHSSMVGLSFKKVPEDVELLLLSLLDLCTFSRGTMAAAGDVASMLPLSVEDAASVNSAEDGGVDWIGARLRKVDSRRWDVIVASGVF